MPLLVLVRHAPAEESGLTRTDEERELTQAGRARLAAIARGLAAIGVHPQVILTSPLVRARQTGEGLAGPLAVEDVHVYNQLAPGHHAEDVVRGFSRWSRHTTVLCVGHLPGIEELASYLLTGTTGLVTLPFRTCSAAAIEVTSIPPRSAGSLQFFLGADALALLGSAAPGRR